MDAAPNPPNKTAIYVRISQDTEGESLGVLRQERECRELAARLGWTIVEVYSDNDISAYKKKKRKDYQRLLSDIRDGRVTAVIAWAPDRLHRQMRELVPFIDLVNERNVAIQTVVGGQIDLSTAIGKMTAKTLGNIAEFESDQKQERIKSKIDELVRDGKVHNGGPRPFGYTRIYQGEGPRRKIVRDELCEHEAVLIREARDRVFAGASVNSIVVDWNQRGLKTSTGRFWSGQAMKIMLVSGRIAGLKEHHRQVVGKANWAAIVSEEDHQQLRAILTAPGRYSTPRKNLRTYWLSGMVFCEGCGNSMRISRRVDSGKNSYRCPPRSAGGCGGRTIDYDELDRMMTRVVIEYFNAPGVLEQIAARDASTRGETQSIVKAIGDDERRLRILEGQLSDGDEDELPELVASVRKVRRRIKDHRDQLARLAGVRPLVGVDVRDLGVRWESLDLGQRQGLLRLAGVGKVVVGPTEVRGRFDPIRVHFEPVNIDAR